MNVFSFRKPFVVWTVVVGLFFSYVIFKSFSVSSKDQKRYDVQSQAQLTKHIARKSKVEKELPKQTRYDVTKRLSLSEKRPRHEIELHGSRSEIDIFMRKSEARLIETFYDVQGVMQQELYYKDAKGKEYVLDEKGELKKRGSQAQAQKKKDGEAEVIQQTELAVEEVVQLDVKKLEPMQSFRYFEADRAIYDYYTHSFVAYDVNFWTYTTKGHTLVKNCDDLWPESSGSASSMTMCHEGRLSTAQFSAENLSMQVTPEW